LVSKGHHRRKDGSTFPVEVNLRCGIFNDKKYFVGVVKDITEKEVTEEKLNSLVKKLESAEQLASMGSWEFDLRNNEIWWSPNLFRLFYRDPLTDKPSMECYLASIHPDDRDLSMFNRGQIINHSEISPQEFRTNPELGKMRYLFASAVRETDGNGIPVRYYGSVLDITRQRNSEEILKESESKFRTIFDAANVGKSITLVTGELYVNQAFSDMLGYTREVLSTKTWKDITPPEDIEGLEKLMIPLFRGETDSMRVIKRYVKKDGSFVWADVSSVLKRDSKGTPLYHIATIIDISDRVKAEEELESLNKELELRVKERTAQLETANRELEAFSYSVSHDLRAPLRAINGYSQLLLDEYTDSLDERGKQFLNNISKNSLRMDVLITDLLNLSRVSKTELNPVKVDMHNLVAVTFSELATDQEKKEFDFILGDIPSAQCDELLIKQVWQNLISNALKYSARSQVKKIEINGRKDKQEVVYTIRDYGAGFNPQYVNKLFNLFQRLHGNEFPGTGVGLAIVQRIIHRHGGKIWGEGEPDKGACFTFTLKSRGS